MARLAGVDLPKNKHMVIALTYIHGIGRTSSKAILDKVGLAHDTNSDSLTEADVANIRKIIEDDYEEEFEFKENPGKIGGQVPCRGQVEMEGEHIGRAGEVYRKSGLS